MPNKIGSFFIRLRQEFFKRRLEREIFNRIFPHLEREANHGYLFDADEEMNALTKALDAQALLDRIERHASSMPKAYGEAFRHVMHRDLHARLSMYEQVAKLHVRRQCNPRFVATRLEPAQ